MRRGEEKAKRKEIELQDHTNKLKTVLDKIDVEDIVKSIREDRGVDETTV